MQRGESVDFYRSFGVMHHIPEITRLYEIPHKGASFGKYFQCLDILFIDRRFLSECRELIKAAKHQGIKVVIDIDDDLFNIGQYHDALHLIGAPNVQESIKESIGMADMIIVTTKTLKQLYSEYNANIHIVPNAWNDYAFPNMATIRTRKGKPRIAWRGSNSHRRDIQLVSKSINATLEKAVWSFYGLMPSCIEPNVMYIPFQPLNTFFSAFSKNAPDYVAVPLENIEFNRAKSNIAWIEATVLCGAVAIAPIDLPEFDKPGVLGYKGIKGFDTVLNAIISGKIDREEMVMQSQKYIAENLRLSEVNKERARLFQMILQPAENKELQPV